MQITSEEQQRTSCQTYLAIHLECNPNITLDQHMMIVPASKHCKRTVKHICTIFWRDKPAHGHALALLFHHLSPEALQGWESGRRYIRAEGGAENGWAQGQASPGWGYRGRIWHLGQILTSISSLGSPDLDAWSCSWQKIGRTLLEWYGTHGPQKPMCHTSMTIPQIKHSRHTKGAELMVRHNRISRRCIFTDTKEHSSVSLLRI